jgi:hypothetical protein
MYSRSIFLALLVVLTGAVIYIAWQQPRTDSPWVGRADPEPKLISLEEAIKNSGSSTVRSNAVISVESCKQAQDKFLRDTTSNIPATATPEEISAGLQSILAQVNSQAEDETHLTCLMHQSPVTPGNAVKSKSG